MKQKLTGGETINGKNGMIWWDGEPILEVQSFEATVTAEREEVDFAMKMGRLSKIVGLTGEGTMTLKKVYSRAYRRYLEAWKAGEDPISTISSLLDDPGSPGGQNERVTLGSVWVNELPLTNFEQTATLSTEIGFGFDPDEVDIQETIDA